MTQNFERSPLKGLHEFAFMYFGLIITFSIHAIIIDILFDTQITDVLSVIISCVFLLTPFFLGAFGNLLAIRKHCYSYNFLSENHYVPIKEVIATSELDAISIIINR